MARPPSKPGILRPFAGWMFAVFLVALAMVGPISGPNLPALLELRNDVLTIDAELERFALRAQQSTMLIRSASVERPGRRPAESPFS